MGMRIDVGSFEIDLSRRGVFVSRVGARPGEWDVHGYAVSHAEARTAGHSWWVSLARGAAGACGPVTRLVLCGVVHDFYSSVPGSSAEGALR